MCDDGRSETISYSADPAAGHVIRPQGSHQWFALAVKPRFDKAVARALEVKGYARPSCPCTRSMERVRRSPSCRCFPGYVCCRFDAQTRLPILTTPGVIQVLGAGNRPIPLSDVEVNSLQTAIRAQIPVQPFPFVGAGQRVRINRGFLAGVGESSISCKHRLRLVLSITLLQRSVLLEIDRDLVSVDAARIGGGTLWALRQAQLHSIWSRKADHQSCADHQGCRPSCGHSVITEEWSIADCMRILLRRKATLLWITGIGSFRRPPDHQPGNPHVHQSRASLEVQSFNENFLALRDIYPTATSSFDAVLYVQTQVELLQQDSLIQEAARKLRLGERPEFQPPAALVSKLRQHIKIVPLRNSRIVQIVCDARDAQLASDLANALARTFIEQNIEGRQRAARQTYESLRQELDALRHELLQPVARSAAKPGAGGERGAGMSEADANRRFYEAMLEKANDARMASVVSQANIRLIAPAEPAARPYKPNLMLNLALGILGGFVLAIGWVLLQEQSTPALHAPGEAGTYLALPELGAIPNDGANGKLRVERAVLGAGVFVSIGVVSRVPWRILSRNGDSPHVLVVTSSRPMEGKTTVVSNLRNQLLPRLAGRYC